MVKGGYLFCSLVPHQMVCVCKRHCICSCSSFLSISIFVFFSKIVVRKDRARGPIMVFLKRNFALAVLMVSWFYVAMGNFTCLLLSGQDIKLLKTPLIQYECKLLQMLWFALSKAILFANGENYQRD